MHRVYTTDVRVYTRTGRENVAGAKDSAAPGTSLAQAGVGERQLVTGRPGL